MANEIKKVIQKLDTIKSELDYIKNNMIPIDAIISKDDKVALVKARQEYEKGETTSLEDLKKELEM